jgi:hypothetical protein
LRAFVIDQRIAREHCKFRAECEKLRDAGGWVVDVEIGDRGSSETTDFQTAGYAIPRYVDAVHQVMRGRLASEQHEGLHIWAAAFLV